MKKLMIVAALVAAGSVFAGDCTPIDPPEKDTADVYNLKLTGKTTAGKKTTVKGDKGTLCGPGGQATQVVPRVAASLAIEGWLAACPYACDKIDTESSTEYALWQTKPYKGSATEITEDGEINTEATIEWPVVWNVMGVKQADFEAAGTLTTTMVYDNDIAQTFTLSLAGLGKFKKGVVTSISGNFAGTATYSYYVGKGECLPTVVWACDDLDTNVEGVDTVAYGSWSLKRNSSASKKYASKGVLPAVKIVK